MGVRLEGIAEARRALAAAKGMVQQHTLLRRMEMAWDDTVLAIQGLAQKKAPLDEGTLTGSAVSRSEFTGSELVGQIQFGGLASQYASDQHEHEEYHHPKKGTDHFLFGKSYSAWEESQGSTLRKLDHHAELMAEEILNGR